MATPSHRGRSPHLPEAQGPPRSFSPRPSFFGRKRSSMEGNPVPGNARGDPGAGNEGTVPDDPAPGLARGDSGAENRRSMPRTSDPGFAGGDPGVKKEPVSHEASNPGAARGDPSGNGPYVPNPAVPKEEIQESWFTTPRFRRSEPCPANTPLRARDPVAEEAEKVTPGITALNFYKEVQNMSFLNWPDMRGFEAWKITSIERLPPNRTNQRRSYHGCTK